MLMGVMLGDDSSGTEAERIAVALCILKMKNC